MNRSTLIALTLVAVGLPSTALAGPASDAVRYFYGEDVSEKSAANRSRFTDPALTKLNAYDRTVAGGALGCIDWIMSIDAQDVDEKELQRTLDLQEQVSGDAGTVTARFQLFSDQPQSRREVIWDVRRVNGEWKIADIAAPNTGWRLSALDCSVQ